MSESDVKLEQLKSILRDMGSAALAYSGGVDSTFLLTVAKEVLGDKIIAITARSSTYPEREFNEACQYIEKLGVKHIVIYSEELDIEGFSKNPKDRCYYCKKELMTQVKNIAEKHSINVLLDGSNYDDLGDYRPGMKAAKEMGVRSPLKEAMFTKKDIRQLSKIMGVPSWNKPSFACLASRFPYGHEITREKLKMVEDAEQYLIDLGFRQLRVRHHEEIARIEVSPEEMLKLFDLELMDKIVKRLKDIGFKYVTMDMQGYRTGSMNEVLQLDNNK
ncbi:ATP-dependent sacrificial sulfur transferase LarE [Clostridium thermarum]|uniref:ATP-dependent sacrificial sulfur transferase LarE n=1 Tax=Clostridium thermarum TaxID=1716543 RepID=UPI001120FDE8|nr:ATP-dependent sacrificial sulfur transferase LarE [Clostridium thermarum]